MNQVVPPASLLAKANEVEPVVVVQPVVLAGASGARLWPALHVQREHQPGPLEATLRRLNGLFARPDSNAAMPIREAAPLVVSSADRRFTIADCLARSGVAARIVLEPVERDTAPAVTVAALAAEASLAGQEHTGAVDDDPVLVVMPTGHRISGHIAFAAALKRAVSHAARGAIVALGVPPLRARTGYGYIGAGRVLDAGGARAIERFVEKPAVELAERYVASGDFWWSSGIFVVRASVWLAVIARLRPEIALCCAQAFECAKLDADGSVRLDTAAFAACPADSIGYAVMESIGTRVQVPGVVVPLVASEADAGEEVSLLPGNEATYIPLNAQAHSEETGVPLPIQPVRTGER